MFAMEGRVRFSECDMQQKLTIGSLVNYFQDCCNLQAIDDGISTNYLTAMGKAWILNSWQIVINRLPEAYEDIKAYTWPYEFKGFFGMRNFKLTDALGNVCAYADSTWTLVDITTGKPSRISEEFRRHYHMEPPYPMEHSGRKILMEQEGSMAGGFEVQLHHLDVNHHMNNAQYILAATDYLPQGFDIGQLRVEYRRQTLLAEKLRIYKTMDGESVTIVMRDEADVIHAILKFDKKME